MSRPDPWAEMAAYAQDEPLPPLRWWQLLLGALGFAGGTLLVLFLGFILLGA